ncbi:MAG TPA: hypothetical protein VFG07_04350 [Thermoplasmata archaeon]|nr:hypothetical protein [Thermoplasmata archaeon]
MGRYDPTGRDFQARSWSSASRRKVLSSWEARPGKYSFAKPFSVSFTQSSIRFPEVLAIFVPP